LYGRKKKLICIGGPTASGKTALSLQLAKIHQTEIISVDSRQLYKEMNIGTAKPTALELSTVPHHFINHISIQEHYDIGIFEKQAIELLEEKFKTYDILIAVGGSGLYFKSLLEGIDYFPEISQHIQQKVKLSYQNHGLSFLQKMLHKADPEYYEMVDKNNPVRLIRALCIYEETGQPYSAFRKGNKANRFFEAQCYYLNPERTFLYEKINQRVDQMIKNGLIEEVFELQSFKHLKALQTVGYTELFKYFTNEYDIKEAILKIKQHSRQYAKRQLTWFNNTENWKIWEDCDILKF